MFTLSQGIAMDILRSKYKELRAREIYIKKELSKAKKMPRLKVLLWLDEVDKVRKQAKDIEMSLEYKGSRYLSNYHLRFSAKMLSEKMDHLRRACHFPDGLTVTISVIVDQCPQRSQLLGTIWGNLMDPNVGITSIYGSAGVGKTTAMMKIRNQLSTSATFDSIIWVSVSKGCSLRKLQHDIALQMKLALPVHDQTRRTMLQESLHGRYLIILDDLWEAIPLMEVGIPLPNIENGCKIVLITRDFDVCRNMESDKFIRVDPLSWTEKWNLFVEKAGNMVLDPEIRPFARQVVEMCPGLPFIVTSIGHAMRDETSVEVWGDVLSYLRTHAKEETWPSKS